MTQSKILVAPSILSADFTDMGRALAEIEESGADLIHCDVMDGHFVPNLTFGPKMIADIRKRSKMFLDVHLMVERPEDLIDQYIDAGSDRLTFHIEACVHAHRLANHIVAKGKKAGISLVPSTPLEAIGEIIYYIDTVLVMSVNPGFGGQAFIPRSLDRIRGLVEMRKKSATDFHIAVDGGVNAKTVASVRAAGADTLIAGNAFFTAVDKKAEVLTLRSGG